MYQKESTTIVRQHEYPARGAVKTMFSSIPTHHPIPPHFNRNIPSLIVRLYTVFAQLEASLMIFSPGLHV